MGIDQENSAEIRPLYQFGQFTLWLSLGQLSHWSVVLLVSCLIGQLSHWSVVPLVSCLIGQLSFGQLSFGQLLLGQLSLGQLQVDQLQQHRYAGLVLLGIQKKVWMKTQSSEGWVSCYF